MARPRLKEEEMTDSQRKKQIYNLRNREKKKKEKESNSSQISLRKTKKKLLKFNEKNDLESNEKLIEKKETADAKILQFPVNENREIYPSEREITLTQEVELLKQELSKLHEKLHEKPIEKPVEKSTRRRWGEVFRNAVSPDAVLSAVSVFTSAAMIILIAAVCGYASVKLTSPFFGEGVEGLLAAASAEGLAGLFAIFAALTSSRVAKWSSRLFGVGIVAIVMAFCFDGIVSKVGSEAKKSSDSYKTLTQEMTTSQATVSRLSAQIEALPTDWVSKRAALEGKILEERTRISSLSGKIESISLETGGTWQVLGQFSIRLGLCVALMVLCEMLVGIFKRKIPMRLDLI